MRHHHYLVVAFIKFWFVSSQVTSSSKSKVIKVWTWVSYRVVHQWFQSGITNGVFEMRGTLIVGNRRVEIWLWRSSFSLWVTDLEFWFGYFEINRVWQWVKVLMVSGSCDSHVGLTVVEVDVERLTWKDYLYFNLIDALCVFHLPPK